MIENIINILLIYYIHNKMFMGNLSFIYNTIPCVYSGSITYDPG